MVLPKFCQLFSCFHQASPVSAAVSWRKNPSIMWRLSNLAGRTYRTPPHLESMAWRDGLWCTSLSLLWRASRASYTSKGNIPVNLDVHEIWQLSSEMIYLSWNVADTSNNSMVEVPLWVYRIMVANSFLSIGCFIVAVVECCCCRKRDCKLSCWRHCNLSQQYYMPSTFLYNQDQMFQSA